MAANQLVNWLQQAGFKGEGLRTAYAIAMRESGGRPKAYNPNRKTGDDSYGLFQINMLGSMGPARRKQFGIASNDQLYDPLVNARAAYKMSKGGTDFGAWGLGPNAYRSGAGFDTIKKHYDAFPGAGASASQPTGFGAQVVMPKTVPPEVLKMIGLRPDEVPKGGGIPKSLMSALPKGAKLPAGIPQMTSMGFDYPGLSGTATSESGNRMVQEAYKWLGTPYAWAGGGFSGPSKGVGKGANTVGFDCSGFLQYIWKKVAGVSIPRVTYSQWRTGSSIDKGALKPGDAVFFHPGKNGPEHVGMYIGNDQFIHAPKTGDVVKISQFSNYGGYVGARRYA